MNKYMEYGEEMLEYCGCELPIRIVYDPKSGFKEPHCSFCMRVINPSSKAINKHIEPLMMHRDLNKSEESLARKINEIIELMKASGMMESRRQT
jgi:hypothetical protein